MVLYSNCPAPVDVLINLVKIIYFCCCMSLQDILYVIQLSCGFCSRDYDIIDD